VTALVDFVYKDFKEELKESAVYQNKKMAKMFASFRMLKKIYISFPQIWNIFSKVRIDKSLNISNNDLSTSLLNQSVMAEKVEIVKPSKTKIVETEMELAKYLGNITNFKSEMNLLLQQIPATFVHPKMEKMQFQSQWKVKGELEYRHHDPSRSKVYKEIITNPNSKAAE
jgi:hypothetical protein